MPALTALRVALRKESVDRNVSTANDGTTVTKSLSARRAWIEIAAMDEYRAAKKVALRKESVDRNQELQKPWRSNGVALRKESVDRNKKCHGNKWKPWRRSPQGERG